MSELSDEQKRLLAARLGGSTPARSAMAAPQIPPHGIDGPPPLSAGQESLLFEYHRRADEPVYTVSHSYLVDGPFDIDRFVDALRAVVMAHQPLHIGFGPDRRCLQIDEALQLDRVQLDDGAFAATAKRRSSRRIDIENGPLLHVLVGRLGDDHHGIVLTMHHVSCDAGSLGAFWADLAIAYRGDELPERTISYADHGHWQRSRVNETDEQYWLDQLGAEPQTAEFGFDRPPSGSPNGYLRRRLSASASEIASLSARPFPVFLAAYGVVLQHLGDVEEPTVGVAVSTRDHPATEAIVGFFLAVLPFRLPVNSSTFRDLVGAVDNSFAGGLSHRHVPLSRIVKRLREANIATDLVRTMFVFDEAEDPQLDGVTITSQIHPNGSAVAPITLFVRPIATGWEAAIEFDGRELNEDAAATFLDCFDTALSELLAHPDQPVNALALSRDDATALDIVGPSISSIPVPLSELIADNVEAGPSATAVTCGDLSISYRQLGDRADELAHRLRVAGVGSGDRVALSVGRSVEMIVAILGVLRAGAAYVPLDPDLPQLRVEGLLAQVKPRAVVVVDQKLGGQADLAEILEIPEVVVPAEVDNPTPALRSWSPQLGDSAYVIFTSGSTGTPRGVEVSHANLAGSTLARFDVYDDQPERFLLLSNYGFDSSLVGIFWTLAAGGEIVVPTEQEVHDLDGVARLVSQHEVTHLLSVPTLYDAILRRAPDRLMSLRVAIVAGEAVAPSLVGRHYTMVPRCKLVNEYGPTEATVWATSFECSPDDTDLGSIPIGRPIPGSIARVADSSGRSIPSGMAGELLIGGLGLTAGYLDDNDATARKFVTDPVSGQPMYRTGDRVRRSPDGVLEFLGRVDNQLSIGGLRVEPEELESLISSHAAVGAAVVVLSDLARLAAIVESRALSSSQLSTEILKLCESRLPRALVPSEVEVVASLDRTNNGKVDRSAATRHLRGVEQLASADASITGRVVSLWSAVLGTSDVEADTDFFDAGGDSLQALRLVECLEVEFGRRVGIGELIDARTPAAVARLYEVVGDAPPVRHDLFEELRSAEDVSPMVLLAPGGGNLLAYEALVRSLDQDQAVVGFRLPGSDGRSEPVRSIVEQADHILPQLLATVPPLSGYQLVGWSTGGLLALELASRLETEGYPVAFIAMIDTIYPGFQLATQPGKADKYRSLLADGGLRAVSAHARHRVAIRIRESRELARMRVAERTGRNIDAAVIERQLFEIAFDAAQSYRPRVFDGPVVFYAASGTDPNRTVVPWGEHLARFEAVRIEGEHAEENAMLDVERVGPLADHLQKLLTLNR